MSAGLPLPPPLGPLQVDDPAWRYPSPDCAGRSGVARLRVWVAGAGHAGYVAVVTELGIGVSITNAIADIAGVLTAEFGSPLALIEHWPAAQAPETGEHLDLVDVDGRTPRWGRLWPTSPRHPDHQAHNAWMAAHAAIVLGQPVGS